MPRNFASKRLLPTLRTGLASSAASRGVYAAALIAALGCAGCDIVQGFQQAGDTLFPEQKTYLAAPGVQLLAGGYRGLDLAVGADIYLLARRADDSTGALYAMRYADPHPCEIPSVGRYTSTRNTTRRPPLISYFHEDISRGTLHFADASCKQLPLVLGDAQFPIAETETSIIVRAGSDLLITSPELGTQETLARKVVGVLGGAFGRGYAVRADGNLALFDSDWTPLGSFGTDVVSLQIAGKSVFYADADGVHRLASRCDGHRGPALGSRRLRPRHARQYLGDLSRALQHRTGLCVPRTQRQSIRASIRRRHAPAPAARGSRQPRSGPTQDPFWFFGLRDVDADAGRDTLLVRTPSGKELTLGAHATLQQLKVLESPERATATRWVDVGNDGSGRYLWWDSQGQSKVLAEHAVARASRLIMDFDGALGKLAVTSGDRLQVLAEGVPWPAFEYRDQTQQWTALFHDLILPGHPHEQNGQLSVFYGTLDALEATPIDQPFTAPELLPIAPSAGVFRISPLGLVLSGVIYLADVDAETGLGQLDYRNLDLRFTAHVNSGVSDYLVVQDQVCMPSRTASIPASGWFRAVRGLVFLGPLDHEVLDGARGHARLQDFGQSEQLLVQRDVRANAADDVLVERALHAHDGLLACRRVHDHLGQERVVVGGHRPAAEHAGIDAHAVSRRAGGTPGSCRARA